MNFVARYLITIFSLFIFTSVFAENDYLAGRVIGYTVEGEQMPMADTEIRILRTTITDKTDERGYFRLFLRKDKNKYKDQVQAGRKINLEISNPGWFMVTPYDGKFYMPKYVDDFDLEVQVISNKSKMKFGRFEAAFSSKRGNNKTPQHAVQVISTASILSAHETKERFIEYGFHPFIQTVQTKKGPRYKVIAAIYPGKNYAKKTRNIIKRKYPKYKDVFIKLMLK